MSAKEKIKQIVNMLLNNIELPSFISKDWVMEKIEKELSKIEEQLKPILYLIYLQLKEYFEGE